MTEPHAGKCLRAGPGLRRRCSPWRLAARSRSIPTARSGPIRTCRPVQQYLFPPMHLAPVVGWKDGEKPIVAGGLKIEALATGLQHPRSLYVLPNGDVLVVESKQPWPDPIHRPKDLVMGWIESWVTSGGDTGPSNRITLLRDADGDGKPETQSRLPRSPQLAVRRGPGRQRPLCRQHRCDRSLSLHDGRYEDHRARHRADAAAGRPDRPPLDQEPGRKPGRLAALCRRRLQQQHHRKRHGGGDEPRRHLGGRPRDAAAGASSPAACATPTA